MSNIKEGGAAENPAPLLSLAELIKNPDLLKPPQPVADRIAWSGRTVLLAAREKDGKSTLATAVAAAVSSGRVFLGATTLQGTVLYVGLEEHLGDLTSRLMRFGSDPNRVYVLHRLDRHIEDIDSAVRKLRPTFVVVDTLAALTSGLRLDPGSSTAWTPIMQRIADLARESGCAILILHHARKSDGAYRDSSAIGAGVDVILEMKTNKKDCISDISASGRWPLHSYSLRFREPEDGSDGEPSYELHGGEQSLEVRIRAFIEGHSGCSTSEVRSGVRGGNHHISGGLQRLEQAGAIVDHGDGRSSRWYATNGGAPEAIGPPTQTPTNSLDGPDPEPLQEAV